MRIESVRATRSRDHTSGDLANHVVERIAHARVRVRAKFENRGTGIISRTANVVVQSCLLGRPMNHGGHQLTVKTCDGGWYGRGRPWNSHIWLLRATWVLMKQQLGEPLTYISYNWASCKETLPK